MVKQRAMLCDVYGYLKDRLNQADAAGAALAFQPSVRDQYESFFTSVGPNMPSIVPALGVIANGIIDVGYAQLIVVRDEANQTHKGFSLKMTRDADGVWRIGAM